MSEGAKPGLSFVTIPLVILGMPHRHLSFASKCLYGLLRVHGHLPAVPSIDEKQGPCFPGEDTLARELGVSSKRIRECKVELRDCGLISWRRTGRSNRYEVFHPSRFKAVDRKQGSDQSGRKVPVGSDERFRSDRKESSDKKNSKRISNRDLGKEGEAAALINSGDLAMYVADEPDFG
jgi:hypothetical protein